MLLGSGQVACEACRSAGAFRDDVLVGDLALSVRLWKRPQVGQGGRYGGR
jgi:hypothetical protein